LCSKHPLVILFAKMFKQMDSVNFESCPQGTFATALLATGSEDLEDCFNFERFTSCDIGIPEMDSTTKSLAESTNHLDLDTVMTTDGMTRREMVAHMLASTPKNVGQIQCGKSKELQDEDSMTFAQYEQQSDGAMEEKEVTEMEDVHSYGVTSDSPHFYPEISKSKSQEFHLLSKNLVIEDDSSFPETSYVNSRESELSTTRTRANAHFSEESLEIDTNFDEKGSIDATRTVRLYHENQKLEMCLMHALNALFQYRRYTKKDLDAICKQLAPDKLINPHKSPFRTGNYNADVLMMALFQEDVDVQWFDSRKAQSDLSLNDDFLCPMGKYSEFLGFIVNEPQKRMRVFNSRHWKTIKRINEVWYDLDSKLSKAKQLKEKELLKWLVTACSNGAQIMICRKKMVQKMDNSKGNFLEIQDGNSPESAPSMTPEMDESKVPEPEFWDDI